MKPKFQLRMQPSENSPTLKMIKLKKLFSTAWKTMYEATRLCKLVNFSLVKDQETRNQKLDDKILVNVTQD